MKNKIIFLITFLFALLFLLFINNPTLTGHATFATKEEARAVVNVMSADNSLKLLGEGAQLCVVVEIDQNTTYYFSLTKTGSIVDIQERYCADPGKDNVIVKFNSYDDLLSARGNPETFFFERKNSGYYLFRSNYIEDGGNLKCTQSFQQRYCAPFYYYLDSNDLASENLICCANYQLTAQQQRQIENLKSGKESTLQSPMEFIFSTTGLIIIISIIVLIIIITSLVVMKPKNPLSDYVHKVKSQGYDDDQIKDMLLQSGWDQQTIDDALKKK